MSGWVIDEHLPASGTAEVDSLTLVLVREPGAFDLHGHPAHWIHRNAQRCCHVSYTPGLKHARGTVGDELR
jgi:hypothetical protein